MFPLPLLLVVGFLLPSDGSATVATPAAVEDPGEAAYRALPTLPVGVSERGRGGVEASAISLAAALRAVPVAEGGAPCDPDDLRVLWEAPGDGFRHGALVEPLGPAPSAATEAVNGAVVCQGAGYAYMGFEARWAGERWEVVAVPFIDETEEHLAHEPAPAPPAPAPAGTVPPSMDRSFAAAGIEGYAPYEPQRTCDPSPKPGTVSLQRMLLNGNPGSRNLGISRSCGIGGQSEHKEGRAFDWGVHLTSARERAQADGFVAALLATDPQGNRHALARRMGVMYVIWNRQIWSSHRASAGWRPYSGASPHTDHVHISLSWAGALGRTSFWSGTVPADLVAMPGSPMPGGTTRVSSTSRSGGHEHFGGGDHGPTATTEAERVARGDGEHRRRRRHEPKSATAAPTPTTEVERERAESTARRRRRSQAPAPAPAAPSTTAAPAPAPAPAATPAPAPAPAPSGGRRHRRAAPAPAPAPAAPAPAPERRRRERPAVTAPAPAPAPVATAPSGDGGGGGGGGKGGGGKGRGKR